MKELTKKWIKRADKHMRVAEILKSHRDFGEDTFYHCQQAIELYLKVFLLENNWKLVKTHNLVMLYNEVSRIKNLNVDEEHLEKIDDNYNVSRYPDDEPYEVTSKNAKLVYDFAKEIGDKIKQEVGIKVERAPELEL